MTRRLAILAAMLLAGCAPPRRAGSPLPGWLPLAIAAAGAGLLLLASGCVTRVYVFGEPTPESVTILNGTFWRSAGGMDAASVSNSVSGGATIKGAMR